MTNYTWTDNTMRSGSTCNVDEVADNLMHLKYNSAGIQLGTCSTASATTEKAVTLDNFSLSTGATVLVTFTNANTATSPTLNVNSTGAISIASEDGTACSSTNPAYFPSGSTVEFTYDGTHWVFKKRVVTSYVNGASWYRVYSDGWIEQGGVIASASDGALCTVTFLKPFSNTNYSALRTAIYWDTSTNGGTYNSYASGVAIKAATYLNFLGGNNGILNSQWYACGY